MYFPEQGTLVSKDGKVLRDLRKDGYVQLYIENQRQYAHRVAWRLYYGEWPDRSIDHIDGNKSNNKISNLRLADMSQQKANARINSNNTSGYRGVHWNTAANKFQALLKHRGRAYHLGLFATAKEAHVAYQKKFNEIYGKFLAVSTG
jgi:hypothetical protein